MKKRLVLVVILAVLLAVFGCGGSKDEDSSVISDLKSDVMELDSETESEEIEIQETLIIVENVDEAESETEPEITETELQTEEAQEALVVVENVNETEPDEAEAEPEVIESEETMTETATETVIDEKIEETEEVQEELVVLVVVENVDETEPDEIENSIPPEDVGKVESEIGTEESDEAEAELEEEEDNTLPEVSREVSIIRRKVESILRTSLPTALALDTDDNLYAISYNYNPSSDSFVAVLAVIDAISGKKISEISAPLSVPDDVDISYDNECLYIADIDGKIVINEINGEITIVDKVSSPAGIAIGKDKKCLYFTDVETHSVYQMDLSDNSISLLAGSGIAGYFDGIEANVQFNTPVGIIADVSNDNLYIADAANNRIRKINIVTKEVTSFAGSGNKKTEDGIGTEASFDDPAYIAINHKGDKLYVVEYDGRTVREIDIATKEVSTIIDQSFGLKEPRDIVVNNNDSILFLADYGNHQILEASLNEFKTITISLDGSKYFIPRTGQTASYYPNDDGNVRMGVPWPNSRFTENGDGTVTDNLTGLMWTKDVAMYSSCCSVSERYNCGGIEERHKQAIDYCENLSYAGHDDWRMPDTIELESMLNYGSENNPNLLGNHPFINDSLCNEHWSSNLNVNIETGNIAISIYPYACLCAWPVRNVDNVGFVQLNRITSPNSRFTDNSDGTVTDNLTDLVWARNMNLIKSIDPEYGNEDEYRKELLAGQVTWEKALDWCDNLVFAGHDDWRIPNRREMLSLLSFHSDGRLVLPDDNPFIVDTGVGAVVYWSSTNTEGDYVYTVTKGASGWESYNMLKNSKYKVWPIRGGFKF